MRVFQQTVKPASFVVCGTLQLASLAQGRPKPEAVPYSKAFMSLVDNEHQCGKTTVDRTI